MKKLLPLFLQLLISINCISQTFTCSPNDSIVQDIDANSTTILKIDQLVSSSVDTVNLEIEVVYNDIPSTWDGLLCIQGFCMGSIVPVGTTAPMVPIHNNLDGYTRLTVNPMGNTGMVKYRVYVYDTNFPDDGDTVTWLLNSVNMTSVKKNATKNIRLFPNPAQDWLSLSLSQFKINTLHILNASGQVIQRHTVNNVNNLVINISELPKGIYTIQAKNHQGYVNAQQFIKQ